MTSIVILGETSFVVFGRFPFGRAWQARHHMACRLAAHGPVVYVEDPSRPSAIVPRIRVDGTRDGITLVRPSEVAMGRIRLLRYWAGRRRAAAIRRTLGSGDRLLVAILYPRASVADARHLCPDLVVYHATDEYSCNFDGTLDRTFVEWERRMLSGTDLVVAASTPLLERYKDLGHPRVELLENGFDDHTFDDRPRGEYPALKGIARPILGFAGVINADRLDIDLLREVSGLRPHWNLVFMGKTVARVGDALAGLRSLPNVHLLDPCELSEVPSFLLGVDVAMCPNRDAPVNRGYYPMKVLDALAMGRGCVITPGCGLRDLHPHAVFARDGVDFVHLVEAFLDEGNAPASAARRRAAVSPRTWTRKVEVFMRYLKGHRRQARQAPLG